MHNDHIGLMPFQHFHKACAVFFDQSELSVRIITAEPRNKIRKIKQCIVPGCAKRELSFHGVVHFPQIFPEYIDPGCYITCHLNVQFPGVCRIQAVFSSYKQFCAELFFDLFEALCQGRLSDMKTFCRMGDVSFFCNRKNVQHFLFCHDILPYAF